MSLPPAILTLVLAACTALGGARQAMFELTHAGGGHGHWHLCLEAFGGLDGEHHHHRHADARRDHAGHAHDGHDHLHAPAPCPPIDDCNDEDEPDTHRAPDNPEFVRAATPMLAPLALNPVAPLPAWLHQDGPLVSGIARHRPPPRDGPHEISGRAHLDSVILQV